MNKVNLISDMPDRYEMRESFKALRTNVLFSGPDVKVISITSTVQNEGKSFVAVELAKSLAETGKKILLLDGDLRKSTLGSRHAEKEGALFGMSHTLSGQMDFDSVIYKTQFPCLDVVFSGPFPPNPVELIGSDRFINMLDHFRSLYDYIIVDTPPLSSVIDSAVISSHCDGTILNIAEGKVSYRAVRTVKTQLERTGAHIIGAVLNFVSSNKMSYSNYYNRYYNRYYKSNYYNYSSDEKSSRTYASLNGEEKK